MSETADLPGSVELDPPVETKGGTIHSIPVREPTAAEMRKAMSFLRNGTNPEATLNSQISLVVSVSGLSQQAVDQIPFSKVMEAADAIQGFIDRGQQTGRP